MHISADGLLWLGTDNGLYIYDESLNRYEHAVHSSQNTKSLVNNIIWHILRTGMGNMAGYRIGHFSVLQFAYGGINRFDYATETFENYQIADSTHTRNANWTYYINGDNHSNLYLVAYCGGVFVVNKEKLLSQKGKLYVADENYYHHWERIACIMPNACWPTMARKGWRWLCSILPM